MLSRTSACLLLLMTAALVGCGGSGAETIPVKGVVTLGGGPWPTGGTITFSPVASSGPLRPAAGAFKPDGTFVVTSFKPGDGLTPGKYEISVECWAALPEMSPTGAPSPGKSAVPEKFRSGKTSGWVLEVPVGSGPLEVKYDVPK
jgi:hypothetical protein